MGVGVDIVKVERFEKIATGQSPRFLTRVYTEKEQAYLKGKPAQSYAGIFAAKEAVAKAMGTGFSGFWPSAIEILHDSKGKPYVSLTGYSIEISISHTATDAIAFAVTTEQQRLP